MKYTLNISKANQTYMYPQSMSHFEVKGHLCANLIEKNKCLFPTYFYNFLTEKMIKDKSFAWHSAILLKMASKMAARLLYVWHYVSVARLNGCLNRRFFMTIWVKDIRTCMIPKVTHTVGSKHTLSFINSTTPFGIKYHLRAILWKIIHISDTYL